VAYMSVFVVVAVGLYANNYYNQQAKEQAQQAERERQQAEQERKAAEEQAQQAKEQAQQAERERQQAEQERQQAEQKRKAAEEQVVKTRAYNLALQGKDLYEQGKYREASDKLNSALEDFPNYGFARFIRGQVYLGSAFDQSDSQARCQQLNKAEEDLEVAINNNYDKAQDTLGKVRNYKVQYQCSQE